MIEQAAEDAERRGADLIEAKGGRRAEESKNPRSLPRSASSDSGSTLAPFTRTVQCRCGPVTRPVAPTSPIDLACRDQCPYLDVDAGQMRKQGEQAQPVVDDHRVAREVLRAGEDDTAGVRRLDRSSFRAQKVRAAVRASRLAVEHASRSESAVGRIGHRPEEGAVPQLRCRRCRPDAIERLRILLDLLEASGGGLTKASSTVSVRVGNVRVRTTSG